VLYTHVEEIESAKALRLAELLGFKQALEVVQQVFSNTSAVCVDAKSVVSALEKVLAVVEEEIRHILLAVDYTAALYQELQELVKPG
jgi:hypothetical protein